MKDAEHEPIQDDLDVEITDLPEVGADDAGQGSAEKDDGGRSDTNKGGAGRSDAGKGRPYDIRLPFKFRLFSRRRALRYILPVSVVVLTLLVIFGSSDLVRNTVELQLFGPTPTPTTVLIPGEDLFYIQETLSWGNLSIDGQMVSHLPRLGIDPPLRLTRGLHLLIWRVEPFLPQVCYISVPATDTGNNCYYGNQMHLIHSRFYARVILLFESLAMLPDDQHTALIHEIQANLNALQSTDTVRAGEQYLAISSDAPIHTAIQPLHATLSFQLVADTTSNSSYECIAVVFGPSCDFQGQDCHLLCTITAQTLPSPPPLPERSWNVLAVIRSNWEYTQLDGKIVAPHEPDDFGGDTDLEHLLILSITRDSLKWHVTRSTLPSGIDPACAATYDGIEFDSSYQGVGGDINGPVHWNFVVGPKRAAGCLAVATVSVGSNVTPSSTPSQAAYCLHRFGILLAANDVAHRYWPHMPLADAYEQKLVQQLIAYKR